MNRFRHILITIFIVVALMLAAMFAWYNPQPVDLDLGVTVIQARVAYIVIASLAVGWLLGLLSALVWIIRLARRNRRERRATRIAESELEGLRKFSAADDV
jgi:uncharacterized integral membrane protein